MQSISMSLWTTVVEVVEVSDNIFEKIKAALKQARVDAHIEEKRKKEREQGIHQIDEQIRKLEQTMDDSDVKHLNVIVGNFKKK